MDFVGDFEVPVSLSQQIDWESDQEKTESDEKTVSGEEKTESDEEWTNSRNYHNSATEPEEGEDILYKSPVFSREKGQRSPIIKSKRRAGEEVGSCHIKRRLNYPTPADKDLPHLTAKVFLRALLPCSQEPKQDHHTLTENQEVSNSVRNLSAGGLCRPQVGGGPRDLCSDQGVRGSSWITGLVSNSQTARSESSTSCSPQISSEGSELGPNRPQPPGIEVRAGDLRGSSWLGGLERSQEQQSLESSPSTSEEEVGVRRRRPVKGGLVDQLEKSLRWEKSNKVLMEHQHGQRSVMEEGGTCLTVERASVCGEVVVITGQESVIIINKSLCPSLPLAGSLVSLLPPWSQYCLQGRTVFLGSRQLKLEQQTAAPRPEAAERETTLIHLHCPCLSDSLCPGPYTRPQPTIQPLVPTSSGLTFVRGRLSPPSKRPNRVILVRNIVERQDGCSPDGSTGVLILTVHRVFQRLRRREKVGDQTLGDVTLVDETIDLTSHEPVSVSLLCEDTDGDFTVVKLGLGVRGEEGWKVVIESEAVEGSKVQLTGSLEQVSRVTRGKGTRLFQIIDSVRPTDQRFCYVLRSGRGSSLKLLKTGVVELRTCRSLTQVAILGSGVRRVNLWCLVLGQDQARQVLYLLAGPTCLRASCQPSFLMPPSVSPLLPAQVLLAGLMVKVESTSCLLEVDGYSSLLQVSAGPTNAELAQVLPSYSSLSRAGDLVLVEGLVEVVRQGMEPHLMVCQVGGVRVVLSTGRVEQLVVGSIIRHVLCIVEEGGLREINSE